MADFSRQGLKKNELEDFILKTADWAKNNRQLFSGVSLTAAAVVALTVFFFARYHMVRLRADEKLAYGQANYFQGKAQDAMGIFDEIISQYPGTAAAYKSRLHKATYLLEMRQFDEAEKIILPAVEEGKPKTIIPLAMSVLGAIRENAGKYKEAISAYNTFLDNYPEHFFAPKIYESLARVYELNGSPQDARATYEKLATLYPASAWAQRAQARIASITGAQQQAAEKLK